MNLSLHHQDTIQDIQQKFRKLFSNLKIEFYRQAHGENQGTNKDAQYLHNVKLVDITGNKNDLEIAIDPMEVTHDFELRMQKEYNLNIQVFRLQGNVWLQTTSSDDLSLKVQNEKGAHIATASAINEDIENTEPY